MEHFVRSDDAELEKLAANATHLDDIDIVQSRVDGALVVIAMKTFDGTLRHVCWQCGRLCTAPDHPSTPELKSVEVKWGGTRIALHPGCMDGKPSISIYFNTLKGLQHRRELARVAHLSKGIATAAKEGARKIIARI